VSARVTLAPGLPSLLVNRALLSVCSLHFTHSLHFTPGLQSAARSLHFTLTESTRIYKYYIRHSLMKQETELTIRYNVFSSMLEIPLI